MIQVDVKKRPTLADVAKAAGVSKMTASRALRRAGDVSKASTELVIQAAKDIGYVGNHLAMSLSGQRSNLIGVIVPSVEDTASGEVMAGIADGLEHSAMQPMFGVTGYDQTKEYDVVRNMLSWMPAGLIVTGIDQADDTQRLLKNADIPIVQIMDTDGIAIDACVGFSHIKAGEAMADALLAAGRKTFGYIGCGLTQDTCASKRLGGFKKALAKKGLRITGIETSDKAPTISAGRRLTARVLARTPEVDCIYYSNDDLAAGGAFHCLSEGISVPERLTLAGFDGLELLNNLPFPVVTSLTRRRQIGQDAVDIILAAKGAAVNRARQVIEHKPKFFLRDEQTRPNPLER